MRLEVIGWTHWDNKKYPDSRGGKAAERAVINAIREGGYRFGGDTHQQSRSGVPVFNDGTKAKWSMRGWGEIMAKALELDDSSGMAHTSWYMSLLHKPEEIVLPKAYVDKSRIVPAESLAEVYEMKLNDDQFELMKKGKKEYETRLNDDRRSRVEVGDIIIFSKVGNPEEKVRTKVEWTWTAEFFEDGVIEDRIEQFGFPKGATVQNYAEGMRKIYSTDNEKKYGVRIFYLKLLK